MRLRTFLCIAIAATAFSANSVVALSYSEVLGTKCARQGQIRTISRVKYVCTKSGSTLSWRKVGTSPKSSGSSKGSGATVPASGGSASTAPARCRSMFDIYGALPTDVVKREWDSVVEKLQPIAAAADASGKTTAFIDTFDDPATNTLIYGRYYPMNYPKAIPETSNGACAYLALVLDVWVRFTGADTSDAAAKNGIQAAVKAILQEVIAKYTKVDGYGVDVIHIQPVLDYCPGRVVRGARSQCPWNDFGFLFFRTASLSVDKVAATPASEIFGLSEKGATFPPRPFDQIYGIGPSSVRVTSGTVRDMVPSENLSHQATTYVEFSMQTTELGQTFRVDSALPVRSISIRTSQHVSVVGGRTMPGGEHNATIQTRVYRHPSVGDLPTALRRDEFVKLLDVTNAVTFRSNSSVSISLPSGTVLSPGNYLVTFAISNWNPVGAYVRLESFAEGNIGQTDAYVGGRAYRGCNQRMRIGYRLVDSPSVEYIGEEPLSTNCNVFYPEISKGENPARPMQHTFVWSDMALTLNAP